MTFIPVAIVVLILSPQIWTNELEEVPDYDVDMVEFSDNKYKDWPTLNRTWEEFYEQLNISMLPEDISRMAQKNSRGWFDRLIKILPERYQNLLQYLPLLKEIFKDGRPDVFKDIIVTFLKHPVSSNYCPTVTLAFDFVLWLMKKKQTKFLTELVKVTNIVGPEQYQFYEKNLPIWEYIVKSNPNIDGNMVSEMIFPYCRGNNALDFTISIPPELDRPDEDRENMQNSRQRNLKILHLTDVHFDPKYVVGSEANCWFKPICCQDKNLFYTSSPAGMFGDYGKCDTSLNLLRSTLNDISYKHPDIDYIYFTGDIISHRFWDTTPSSNAIDIDNFFIILKQFFPNTPVLPTLGNHEADPMNALVTDDLVDDKSLSSQWLFEVSADIWVDKLGLPYETKSTIKQAGHYSTLVRKGLRVISLNSNFAYVVNWWILHQPNDLGGQLQWLSNTLTEAELAGEQVHILTHLVPSDAGIYTQWGREFRRIIQRFHKIIKVIFYGHTHYDGFTIYLDKQNLTRGLVPAFNGGGVTPYTRMNPNYKIFTVQDGTFEVLDYDNYSFNLTEANLFGRANWQRYYSFKELYGIKDMKPQTIADLVNNRMRTKEMLTKYNNMAVKYGDLLLNKCEEPCLKHQLCSITRNDWYDDEICNDVKRNLKLN